VVTRGISKKGVQTIKVIWCVSIVISIFLIFIVAKYSLWQINNKLSLALFSLPIHIGILLSILLTYITWLKKDDKRRIILYLKRSFLLFLGAIYVVFLILFFWFFIIPAHV
jgi:hypothetical protein